MGGRSNKRRPALRASRSTSTKRVSYDPAPGVRDALTIEERARRTAVEEIARRTAVENSTRVLRLRRRAARRFAKRIAVVLPRKRVDDLARRIGATPNDTFRRELYEAVRKCFAITRVEYRSHVPWAGVRKWTVSVESRATALLALLDHNVGDVSEDATDTEKDKAVRAYSVRSAGLRTLLWWRQLPNQSRHVNDEDAQGKDPRARALRDRFGTIIGDDPDPFAVFNARGSDEDPTLLLLDGLRALQRDMHLIRSLTPDPRGPIPDERLPTLIRSLADFFEARSGKAPSVIRDSYKEGAPCSGRFLEFVDSVLDSLSHLARDSSFGSIVRPANATFGRLIQRVLRSRAEFQETLRAKPSTYSELPKAGTLPPVRNKKGASYGKKKISRSRPRRTPPTGGPPRSPRRPSQRTDRPDRGRP